MSVSLGKDKNEAFGVIIVTMITTSTEKTFFQDFLEIVKQTS